MSLNTSQTTDETNQNPFWLGNWPRCHSIKVVAKSQPPGQGPPDPGRRTASPCTPCSTVTKCSSLCFVIYYRGSNGLIVTQFRCLICSCNQDSVGSITQQAIV